MQLIPCKICGKQSDSIEEYVRCLMECENGSGTAKIELLKHTKDKKWYETGSSTHNLTKTPTQNKSSTPFTSCFSKKLFLNLLSPNRPGIEFKILEIISTFRLRPLDHLQVLNNP